MLDGNDLTDWLTRQVRAPRPIILGGDCSNGNLQKDRRFEDTIEGLRILCARD